MNGYWFLHYNLSKYTHVEKKTHCNKREYYYLIMFSLDL